MKKTTIAAALALTGGVGAMAVSTQPTQDEIDTFSQLAQEARDEQTATTTVLPDEPDKVTVSTVPDMPATDDMPASDLTQRLSQIQASIDSLFNRPLPATKDSVVAAVVSGIRDLAEEPLEECEVETQKIYVNLEGDPMPRSMRKWWTDLCANNGPYVQAVMTRKLPECDIVERSDITNQDAMVFFEDLIVALAQAEPAVQRKVSPVLSGLSERTQEIYNNAVNRN